MQTFYFLYKTTNLINNKIYVGKHKTKRLNDGYIGSGKLLKRAINKYGRENFSFVILQYFSSEEELNTAEKELVTEEFCLRKDTYNLCVGGKGGFSYIQRENLFYKDSEKRVKNRRNGLVKKHKLMKEDQEYYKKVCENISRGVKESYSHRVGSFTGKKHSEETRAVISERAKQRKTNSQTGTMWITNGIESKKINKTVDLIPEGWYKGRTL